MHANESPRILMAAGGTGGHVFPALAVARELRNGNQNGARPEIEFVGTGRGLEARVIPAAGFPLKIVAAAGLKGIGGMRRLSNLMVLPRSAIQTSLLLRDFRPDVVVGVGGYLAGPVMLEAALKDIPTLLIEPNAVPGFTNRVLAPIVRIAALGFEQAADFYGSKARVTGHAVRPEFFAVQPREHVPPYTVLILGGSQGSRAINKAMLDCAPDLAAKGVKLILQSGEGDYNRVEESFRNRGIEAEVRAFIDNVPEALGRADLVVTRSGAATVAELAAAGKASVLIPYPHAADQHQLQNARTLERAGAARVVEERELMGNRLGEDILELLGSVEKLAAMERNVRTFSRPDAARRIADLVEELIR